MRKRFLALLDAADVVKFTTKFHPFTIFLYKIPINASPCIYFKEIYLRVKIKKVTLIVLLPFPSTTSSKPKHMYRLFQIKNSNIFLPDSSQSLLVTARITFVRALRLSNFDNKGLVSREEKKWDEICSKRIVTKTLTLPQRKTLPGSSLYYMVPGTGYFRFFLGIIIKSK